MTHGPLPVSPGANRLDWDAENRLLQVRAANDTTVITTTFYDAQFRRIATMAGTGGATTLYLYDGFNCIAEYSKTDTAAPALSRTHTWGLDLSGTLQGAGGVGGLLAVTIGGTPYYPTFDGNGNVSEYLNHVPDDPVTTGVNEEGFVVAAHFEYDPFGNTVINTDNDNLFPYRFSTKPLDFATGLYYYTYRYYDPVTGRWQSRDPIGENWITGEYNEYAFITNQPNFYIDVLGLFKDGGYEDVTVGDGFSSDPGSNRRKRKTKQVKGRKTKFKGHLDFDNLPEFGFDYSKEDHRISTWPGVNPGVHFQDLSESVRQAEEATTKCDKDDFQSAMHRVQDYYSHYEKGYRWDPMREEVSIPGGGFGHVVEMGKDAWLPPGQRPDNYDGSPDNDDEAWERANDNTKKLLKKWKDNCCIKCKTTCEWVPKSQGECASGK